MPDTRIIYEDEIEWLRLSLMDQIKTGKRTALPMYFDDDFLYDFMMWLKYGVKG